MVQRRVGGGRNIAGLIGLANRLDVRARWSEKEELRMTSEWMANSGRGRDLWESGVLLFCLTHEKLEGRWQMGSWITSLEFRGEEWAGARLLGVVTSS